MTILNIDALGELNVSRAGKPLKLPASKRARAVLAYLALTARPHRRDRLCEVFFEVPDDPRGALRWVLSKLRSVVNDNELERLVADRERVELETATIDIDIQRLAAKLENTNLSVKELQSMAKLLREPLLAGVDLPEQGPFQNWLTAEREHAKRLLAKTLSKLACHPAHPPNKAVTWTREWLDKIICASLGVSGLSREELQRDSSLT